MQEQGERVEELEKLSISVMKNMHYTRE